MSKNEKKFDKEKKVHEVFEKISENYDEMNSVISFKQHIKWRNDAMKRMDVRPGNACLDLCCGTADWTIAMANEAGPNAKIVGLDFSKNMLAVGQKKVDSLSLKQIELVHGNAMELPFDDNSFDFVTIGFGLRNVKDYLTVLKEMRRILKPGGMAICLETSQPTMPGYRQLFEFYFKYVMPVFGKIFAKSYEEYSWLQESADSFPNAKELKVLFEKANFENVSFKHYSGGAAAAHFGKKAKLSDS